MAGILYRTRAMAETCELQATPKPGDENGIVAMQEADEDVAAVSVCKSTAYRSRSSDLAGCEECRTTGDGSAAQFNDRNGSRRQRDAQAIPERSGKLGGFFVNHLADFIRPQPTLRPASQITMNDGSRDSR